MNYLYSNYNNQYQAAANMNGIPNTMSSKFLNQNNTPITLTWNVSAYVKNKKNLFKKIKAKIRPDENDPHDYNANYNNYHNWASVDNNKYKPILKNVYGIVKPGQCCAIMGASGAGKSTLLNILNFRNQGKTIVEGEVKMNGEVTNWNDITRYSGYVQQDDMFYGTLTVREHLIFMAMMKMGRDYSREDKIERVDEVIQQFGLVKSENTMIGMGEKMKGISGGEKRRLAFASEVLTSPPLLFCDEPTSGLDAFMALSLVEAMSDLAKQGKTIVSTIHQPSSQIFEKFDTLILLAEGRVAYAGSAKEAAQFFASQGYRAPELFNPADFYIQTLSVPSNDQQNGLYKIQRICDSFERSAQGGLIRSEIANAEAFSPRLNHEYEPKYKTNRFSQLMWLLWRQFKIDLRNPLALRILLFQLAFLGLFYGLIFLRLDNNEKGVRDRLGLLVNLLMTCNFGFIFNVISIYPLEMPMIYRESKNRVYSILSFYLMRFLSELPKFIILPMILVSITYWMTGILDNFEVFIQILFTYVFVVHVAVAFATFLSIASPNIDTAVGLAAPLAMPLLIFGGFFLNLKNVPGYFVWIRYISWFYYTYENINILLWRKVDRIGCTVGSSNDTCTAVSCFKNGQDVLNVNSFDQSNLIRNYVILGVLLIVIRVLSFFLLKLKLKLIK